MQICIDSVNYKLIIPTFLGGGGRNFYGDNAPDTLGVVWKHYLGKGRTIISRKLGERIWAGAGWTGQPLIVEENGHPFLIQGAYDHHLKKIDAVSGKLIWQYKFDDVVKGTGSIVILPNERNEAKISILQGSRLGVGNFLDTKHIPSYRSISYVTGEELWRMDQKWTHSYSRDVDGSALIIGDTAYIGFENSLFTSFNPAESCTQVENGMLQPEIYKESKLYSLDDVKVHGGNVVTESSPCLIDSMIYVASGSGHVWGYDLKNKDLSWRFSIGSDIDGSAVATKDSCILVSVEKQYIKGVGGVFKLNPDREGGESVEWYMPTLNKGYASWEGGVIGSCAVNDNYLEDSNLVAFSALDGYLYVVKHTELSGEYTLGPDSISSYPKPKLIYRYKTGPSICTPIFTDDRLIVAGYNGLYLFSYDEGNQFRLLSKFNSTFESTPVVHKGYVYIASRDGNMYCFGKVKD